MELSPSIGRTELLFILPVERLNAAEAKVQHHPRLRKRRVSSNRPTPDAHGRRQSIRDVSGCTPREAHTSRRPRKGRNGRFGPTAHPTLSRHLRPERNSSIIATQAGADGSERPSFKPTEERLRRVLPDAIEKRVQQRRIAASEALPFGETCLASGTRHKRGDFLARRPQTHNECSPTSIDTFRTRGACSE